MSAKCDMRLFCWVFFSTFFFYIVHYDYFLADNNKNGIELTSAVVILSPASCTCVNGLHLSRAVLSRLTISTRDREIIRGIILLFVPSLQHPWYCCQRLQLAADFIPLFAHLYTTNVMLLRQCCRLSTVFTGTSATVYMYSDPVSNPSSICMSRFL